MSVGSVSNFNQDPWGLQNTPLRPGGSQVGRNVGGLEISGQEPFDTQPVSTEDSTPTPTGRRKSTLTPEQGREAAQALLNQQGAFNQLNIQFSQSRPPVELTPAGQRRSMLNGMTRMAETQYQQQTHGAGGAYSNDQLRNMLNTLKPPTNGPQTFAIPPMNSGLHRMWQMQNAPEAPLVNSVG